MQINQQKNYSNIHKFILLIIKLICKRIHNIIRDFYLFTNEYHVLIHEQFLKELLFFKFTVANFKFWQ